MIVWCLHVCSSYKLSVLQGDTHSRHKDHRYTSISGRVRIELTVIIYTMIYTEERRATNGYAQDNCKKDMVAAVYIAHQSSYCSGCNRHFNSLEIPRDIPNTTLPTSPTCQDKTVKVVHNVAGPRWTSGIRPDVKMASRVHYITCHSCSARHRNPPYDYL